MWRALISLDTETPPPCATKFSKVLAWLDSSTGASRRPWRLQAMSTICRTAVSGGGRPSGYCAMRASVTRGARASGWPGGSSASTGAR